MRRSLASQSGMSLIGVLAALAITSVVFMAVAESLKTAAYIRTYIQFNEDSASLRDEIRTLLEPPALCTFTMGGTVLDTTIIGQDVASQAESPGYNLKENVTDPTPTVIGNMTWGRARVDTASIQLRQNLGNDTYIGAVHLHLSGEGLLVQPSPRTVPVTLKMVPGTGEIEYCSTSADFVETIANTFSTGTGTGTGATNLPSGECPAGEYMVGLEEGQIKCSSGTIVSNPSTSGPYSLTNPGPGCDGAGCITFDYGECQGSGCITNGNYCSGPGCVAYGRTAACDGSGCCAGSYCDPF